MSLDECPGCGKRVADFEPGGYESDSGQRGHFACKPLAAVLTGREMARVSRVYTAENPRNPERPKSEYIAGLRAVAARLYPGKVTA